ncbi:hypothetical protein OH686_01185 [Pseudomonas sp. SO81]|nr:hypothetical protein OH686_01185 [Pseudomonas sp. SO81]
MKRAGTSDSSPSMPNSAISVDTTGLVIQVGDIASPAASKNITRPNHCSARWR